jgi:hypothetical protein
LWLQQAISRGCPEVEKATASGKKVKIKEYYPPDVGALRLWLQNRMPEAYREKIEQKRVLSADDAFLKFGAVHAGWTARP